MVEIINCNTKYYLHVACLYLLFISCFYLLVDLFLFFARVGHNFVQFPYFDGLTSLLFIQHLLNQPTTSILNSSCASFAHQHQRCPNRLHTEPIVTPPRYITFTSYLFQHLFAVPNLCTYDDWSVYFAAGGKSTSMGMRDVVLDAASDVAWNWVLRNHTTSGTGVNTLPIEVDVFG